MPTCLSHLTFSSTACHGRPGSLLYLDRFPFSKPTAGSLLGYSKLCHWKLPSDNTSSLSNFLSLPPNPSALGIQIPPQLHFDLALQYFVVWSLCSIRLSTFVLQLWCDIKVITILVANGRIGLDHERIVYCLARLRTMHYFQASKKESYYRAE